MNSDNLRHLSDGKESEHDSDTEDAEEISKSQRKRDADGIRELGEHLTELGKSELATVPLPDDVLQAIHEFSRIKANGARKRQLGYLAKRLRNADIEPIEQALERIKQIARSNTLNLHTVENWRDRLLGDVDGESPKLALTAFLSEFNNADRQQLRQLQVQAIKERDKKRAPAAARQLFKLLRDIINNPVPDY